MTRRQQIALADPLTCRRLIDYPLARRVDRVEGRYGTILTVDRGLNYEESGPWYWHASVSVLGWTYKPMRWADAPAHRGAAARLIADDMLHGVGLEPSEWAEGEKAIHLRRLLTVEEIAHLNERGAHVH